MSVDRIKNEPSQPHGVTRRAVLASPAALFFTMKPPPSRVVPASGTGPGLERLTLDLDYQAPRGGPVEALRDGRLLWMTTGPEVPWRTEAMWPVRRIIMRQSHDGGRSWVEPVQIQRGTKEYSVLSHGLKETRAGTLLHIFTHYSGYDYETASPEKSLNLVFYQRSSDGGHTWTEAQQMPTDVRYCGDILSVTQIDSGRILYPFAFLTSNKGQFASSAMYSDDDGSTWVRSKSVLTVGGGGFESGASEPSIVELSDGRLWMLIRAQTGALWESYSTDGGSTWSEATQSPLPSSNSPGTLLKLKNGNVAVAWNNHVHSNYGRQSLVLGITRDGRHFDGMREIDGTDFPDNPSEPSLHVTYAYLTETDDGTILVSYNKGRWSNNQPALARVRPEWITARDAEIHFLDGRRAWHTVNPGPDRTAAVEHFVTIPDDDTPWLEISQHTSGTDSAGITHGLPLVASGEIEAVLQVVRPDGYVLFGDTLLAPGAIDDACVRVRYAKGQLFVGAGSPRDIERRHRTTLYSYIAHLVETDTPYPVRPPADGTLRVWVRYSAAKSRAVVKINDGPAVDLKTGSVLGLACVGLAVHQGGLLRVNSIRTSLD